MGFNSGFKGLIYKYTIDWGKVKVKCTLVQALRLCTGRTAHRGSRGIALLFHDHGTRREWEVSATPRLLFTPGKDPVPIAQEAGWAPGPVWTGAENLALTGIRSPDHPARSQSLYRLRYPVPHWPRWPSINCLTSTTYTGDAGFKHVPKPQLYWCRFI